MKYLIESFYQAIVNNSPVPIPYREIVLTAKIMDAIFLQLKEKAEGNPSHAEVPIHTG